MKLLFFNIIMWFVVSCNPTQKVVPMNEIQQLSGKYTITTLFSKPIEGKLPFISFNDKIKEATGNGACNGFGGKYTLLGDKLQFGVFRATEMYCDEPVMVTERAFFKALSETQKFDIKNNILTLYNIEGIAVLQAKKEQ